MKREKKTRENHSGFAERLAQANIGEPLHILRMRLQTKRSQTPNHMYYKCQYFSQDDPTVSYVGYLSADMKEASLQDMRFIKTDGAVCESEAVNSVIRSFAIRPYGAELIHIRRRATESGNNIFGRVVNNTQQPIYYYKLGKDGKVTAGPYQLQERARLLRSENCYLFTDEERSFTLYLTGSRNELWLIPTH